MTAEWNTGAEGLVDAPVRSEVWRAGVWMLEQSAVIDHARAEVELAEARLKEQQELLAEFISKSSSPEIWHSLSGEQADSVIANLPE